MKRRAVWRWKSFWLGVLMLCFLGWAWMRSMTWCDTVSWQTSVNGVFSETHGISAWHADGEVAVEWDFYDPFVEDGMHFQSESLASTMGWDRSDPFGTGDAYLTGSETGEVYAEVVDEYGGRSLAPLEVDGNRVTVAYWFLALVFFLGWSGWLVWRWRRVMRARLTEPEMEAEVSR